MNKLLLGNPSSNSKGISLIEILLGLAVLVILLSFAVPSVNGAAIKAEMTAASENVLYSVHVARQTARVNEIPVAMNLTQPGENGSFGTISFSAENEKYNDSVQIQKFDIPPDLLLISDRDSFVFDERGLAKEPGRILLISAIDETVTSTIIVK